MNHKSEAVQQITTSAGNMTFDATSGLNYSFDQENRITGAAGYTYTYDGDGNRVIKANGNTASQRHALLVHDAGRGGGI
jgi:predicted lipoprotein with Yx(FWY)xxD motif